MANSAVAVTAGAGTNVDTFTDATDGDHRQAIVLADPSVKAAAVAVVAANPSATDYGAVTRVAPVGAPYHVVAAASDNAANIKASAGAIRAISIFNNAATPRYVKFHNTAGTPTAGSGVVATFGVQAGTQRDFVIPGGIRFATGIGVSIVTGIADNNTTAVSASDVVLDVFYE
jgi:hypothetical protein